MEGAFIGVTVGVLAVGYVIFVVIKSIIDKKNGKNCCGDCSTCTCCKNTDLQSNKK